MRKMRSGAYLYHDAGSRKGTIHAAYDDAGGGEKGLEIAMKMRGEMRRDGKLLTEGTIKSWISDWNSPNGYHAKKMADLTAKGGQTDTAPHDAAEPRRAIKSFAEEVPPFRLAANSETVAQLVPKRPVNVAISEGILAEARAMDLNLSQILENELRKRVKDERGRRWAEENKGFIESYNAYIERNGVFGEELLELDDPTA